MAGLAIIWRNAQFSQPRRLWTPASVNGKRSVYLVAEPVAAGQDNWRGLPNLEVIRCAAPVTQSVAPKRSLSSGT